jgi:hypothetical protein
MDLSFDWLFWRDSPQWARVSSFTKFLDHTQHTTAGRTPLDEWSVRRRDLYLTTHNSHNRQTSMAPSGFESTISAGERPQNFALDHSAAGTGFDWLEVVCFDRHRTGEWILQLVLFSVRTNRCSTTYTRAMLYGILTPQVHLVCPFFASIRYLFTNRFAENKTAVSSICPSCTWFVF